VRYAFAHKGLTPRVVDTRFAGVDRIVLHGRSITFQMAEVMVQSGMFQQILAAIAALRPLPPAQRHRIDRRLTQVNARMSSES